MEFTALKLIKGLLSPGYRLLKRIVNAARRPALLRKIPPLSSIDPDKPVYVFFEPTAYVHSHYVTVAIVARTLKERGHQVLIVGCEGDYSHCLAMDIAGLRMDKTEAQRREICRRCDVVRMRTGADYGLPSIDISALVDESAKQEIRQQVATMPADAGQFEVDGFRFGALCGSDLALQRKALNQMHATGENRQVLEAYVEGALLSYRAAKALIKTYSVARILYFNEYSMLLGAAIAADKAGVPITRLSQAVYRGIDRSKIMLAAEPLAIYTYHRLLDEWPQWRDLALPPALVESITEHSLLRLVGGGATVYSPGHGGRTDALYDQLGLSLGRRLLVAYPSSMDEYHANMNMMGALNNVLFPNDQPFPDQTTWLRELVTHVEQSSDLQLVIRIHPREGRNVFDTIESDNLANLKRDFSGAYKHVRIIWPEETISSYDLAEIADVALSGWSNISLELARFGIPTLTAFKRYVPFPVGDVVDWCPTADAYFEKIRILAAAPARFDQIRFAYRWTNIYSLSLSLDFDDLIPDPGYDHLPPFQNPRAAERVEDIIVRGASVTEMNRQTLLKSLESDSQARESTALRAAMRQVIWFLATGKKRQDDYVLNLGALTKDADLAITFDGAITTLQFAETTVTRRSNIIRRLAPVAAGVTTAPKQQETALS